MLVGFTLGPVGGGGSILVVPLMVYLVGVTPPHLAIGTSALAVAVNAAGNLVPHARQGTIKWRCAGMYALAVVAGAFANSTIGKAFDGQKLLFLCALLMLVVGVLMLRGRGEPGNLDVQCRRENALKVIAYGSATGFLIVPGLMASTGMPMINVVARRLSPSQPSALRPPSIMPRPALSIGGLRGVQGRLRAWRRGRRGGIAASLGAQGIAQQRVRGADLLRGDLYALEELGGCVGSLQDHRIAAGCRPEYALPRVSC